MITKTHLLEHDRIHFKQFLIIVSQVVFFSLFQGQVEVEFIPFFFKHFQPYFGHRQGSSFAVAF